MKTNYNSGLSNFMRNASGEERRRVFLEVAKQATEDQLAQLAEYDRRKENEEV